MTTVIVILHVICCFMLIIVILIQGGRGQGLTGPSFASGNVQSLFGTRAADVLTKATSVAAILFLMTCISLDFIEAQKARSLLEGPRQAPPIDIEQIKKALAKVKEEAPAPATAEKTLPEKAAAQEKAAEAPAGVTETGEQPSPQASAVVPTENTETPPPADPNAT